MPVEKRREAEKKRLRKNGGHFKTLINFISFVFLYVTYKIE